MAHRRRRKQQRREEEEEKKRAKARARNTKVMALGVVMLVLAGGFAYLAFNSWTGAAPAANTVAPDFALVDSHGNPFRLSDFRGRPVVLFFMTSSDWCLPCKVETRDHLKPLYDTFGNRIEIVSLEMIPEARSDADLNAYAVTYDATWIYARDTEGVSRAYGITLLSTVVIVDQEGHIAFKQTDPTFDQMAAILRNLGL